MNSNWTPAERLPADYKARIERLLPQAEELLRPAAPEVWGVVLDKLMEFAECFKLAELPPVGTQAREDKTDVISRIYLKALSDVPGDLLLKAVEHVTGHHEYRNLPMPGDFRKVVDGELARRRALYGTLRAAHRFGAFEERIPDAERVTPDQLRAMRQAVIAAASEWRSSAERVSPAERARMNEAAHRGRREPDTIEGEALRG